MAARIEPIKRVLSMLPTTNRDNLEYLIRFLTLVSSYEQSNRMTVKNLALVIGPNVMGDGRAETTTMHGCALVETLMIHVDTFFPTGM
jgi:hypothetical protein